jgi:hypothetical protein
MVQAARRARGLGLSSWVVRKVTGETGAASSEFASMPSAAGFSTAIAAPQQEPEPEPALDDVPF